MVVERVDGRLLHVKQSIGRAILCISRLLPQNITIRFGDGSCLIGRIACTYHEFMVSRIKVSSSPSFVRAELPAVQTCAEHGT